MKKHLFTLALSALMAVGASAQENNTTKISVNVGLQWNSGLGKKAGIDALIPFGQSRWGFEPGIYWSMRNATPEETKNDVKYEYSDKVHYIDVPLRFAVHVAGREDGPFSMSFLFGPYFSYGLSGKSHCTITKDGTPTKSEADAFGDKGRLRSRLDYGLNMGVSAVVMQNVKVGVFAEVGLRNIYRPNSWAEDILGDIFGGITKRNYGLGFTVGYQF